MSCFPGEHGLAVRVDYFYAKGDEQHGPLTAEQFAGYVRSGAIAPGDLVWRSGLDTWQPLNISGLDTEVRATSPPAGTVGPHAVSPPGSEPTSSAGPGTVNPYGTPSPSPYPMTPPASGSAILSLVMGILALLLACPIFSIVAIISGHMALSGMKANPHQFSGRGLAIAGLVLGYLAAVVQLLFILMFIPLFLQTA